MTFHIDGLAQERRSSSALAMELRLSCINPSICQLPFTWCGALWISSGHVSAKDSQKTPHIVPFGSKYDAFFAQSLIRPSLFY